MRAELELIASRPTPAELRARLATRPPVEVDEAPAVLHALPRYALGGKLTPGRADEFRVDFADLPIHRYPTAPLLERAWTLRHSLTMYDALYVALAEALDATLVTTDHAPARAATKTSSATIESVV